MATAFIASYQADLEVLAILESTATTKLSKSTEQHWTRAYKDIICLGGKIRCLHGLVTVILNGRLSSEPRLIAAKLLFRAFQFLDEGKRFSSKDPLDGNVKPKCKHSDGFDGVSLDEFNLSSGKRCESLHASVVRNNKFVKRAVGHMMTMYNNMYQAAMIRREFSEGELLRPLPSFLSTNVPTLPASFTDDSSWNRFFELCQWTSKESQDEVKKLVTPTLITQPAQPLVKVSQKSKPPSSSK